MEDDDGMLSAGFAIDTQGAFNELQRFYQFFDSGTIRVLDEIRKVEAATGGMMNLSAATREVTAFGAATKRELSLVQQTAASAAAGVTSLAATMSTTAASAVKEERSLSAERRKTNADLEKTIFLLDRETKSLSQNKEEARAAKIEKLAISASGFGNTDGADRLLSATRANRAAVEARAEAQAEASAKIERALQQEQQALRSASSAYNMFEAAARKGMDALREQQAIDVEAKMERQAQAVRSASSAYQMFEARVRAGVAAMKAEEDAARQNALSEREQQLRSASAAYTMFETKVRAGAQAMREEQAAADRDAATLANLRAMIDPAAASQSRLNAELAEARRVMTAAGASAQELAAAEDALWARSTRATAQHDVMAGAARRSSGALQNIAIQLPDITQGLLTGQKPMTVFIQQGFQIVQVAQMAEGGLRGFGKEVAGLALRFAPFLVGLAAAGAGVALFTRWVNEGVSNEQLTGHLGKITGGADSTKQELFKLKDATISFGDTASAVFSVVGKDIASVFVGDMKGMGKDVKSVLDDLTSYGRATLASMYAGLAGMKAYLGEISSRGGLMKALTGDPTLLDRTFGDAYRTADKYLGDVGSRIRKEALKNAREGYAKTIGFNNEPKPKVDRSAERLARDAEATEAQIRNLYKLADAYGVSGAAALIAEARVKAESDAIKKRGDIETFVERQIRLAVAERVKTGAQNAAAMRDEAAMQQRVNAEVAAGVIPASQAADLLRDRMADLPLLAAIEAASTIRTKDGALAVQESTKALDAQRASRDALTESQRRAQLLAAQSTSNDQLAFMREELRLIGATEVVRARSLAVFKAEQDARAKGWSGPAANDWVKSQGDIAAQGVFNTQAVQNYNDQLSETADRWDIIASNVANAGRGMADAFGDAGRAIGDMASIYADFNARQERAELQRRTAITNGADVERTNARFALANSTAQIGAFGDMASAAKGFFNEKSKGYAALRTAEQAFRAVEFALSVRAMAQDAVETGSSIAKTVARTAVSATEAVVNAIKSLPFPLNLAAGAATAGAIAALGVSIVGSFGGGGNKLPASNTGTGTVLGDRDAKSESIKRAIDGLKDVDTLMLSSSREMASLLRSIDSQIGGVAALVVRAGNVNASGGVGEGFKTNAVGSVLKAIVPVFGGALASLFGTKTTVVGSGLSGGPQTLDSILNGGFDASYYSDVQKKKKLFGITTSTKNSTQYTGADAGLENQFTLILRNFNSAIAAAAGPLGESTDEIQRRLSGFVVNIGKIDLQGLTGDEIQEKLSAVFGAAADNMALAAFPGFERFQKVGEGAFETLVRVASTVESVSASLDLLGGAARGLGIDAKLGLADQFESVSALSTAAQSYFETFYSKEEQAAAKTAQFAKVFDSLGLAMPETLAGFRQLVDAQNLTTAAGQSTYATLLQLAPAFADLKSAMEGAQSAADILAERQDLQRKVLELNGDTAAIRALDLAKVDVSNRALQEQVWAIEDAQKAAEAAKQLSDAWSSVGDSIDDEIKRIRGLDASGGNSFAALQGQFNAASTAARGGDMAAAKLLPALSQALLKSAGDTATSRQELDRVQAQTAASLEATSSVIAALAKGNPLTGAGTVAAAAVAAQAATPTSAAANDTAAATLRMVRDEIAAMRADNNAGHAKTATEAGRSGKVLERVSGVVGGDALGTRAVA